MITRIFGVATIFLAALVVHQYRTIEALKRTVDATAARSAADVRDHMIEEVAARSQDVQGAMAWLNDFYQSQDGLQRAHGICEANGRPDYVALSAWVFDVYLRHRLQGDSDEQSRQAVEALIKQSGEWRGKHPS